MPTRSSTKGEYCSRDAIEDIWGPRTPTENGHWPVRVDERRVREPQKWITSACTLCSNGCASELGVADGKIVAVRGMASDRVNKGRLGPKGLHSIETNSHPDRLTKPLIRKDGRLQEATWEEAMSLIVEKSKDVQKRLTSHGIGFYTSGQLFLEDYYALSLVGKAGLSTLHMDGNTRLCTATAAAAMRESFGCDGQSGSYTDVDVTECLFLVGHNVASTQTMLWARMLDRLHGPKPPSLVVIDPRKSFTARKATVHLAPKIGTNLALLNGIEHILFRDGHVDKSYCDKHVVGLKELEDNVASYVPEWVEDVTGVPKDQLEAAARIIGTAKSLLSTALQGVYQSNQATASACQINNINLIRGLIGKPGSGIYQMNGQPTAQNNRETGCDGEFPGFRNPGNKSHMQELADLWNIEYERVPHWNLPTPIEQILRYMEQGSIELFWISGTNPLVSLPDLPYVRKVLTSPNVFVICQDIFLTETAELADVVLPAAMVGEKTGCFTNVDRTVHIAHKAVEPPGEARQDMHIFVDYARRMGFCDKEGNPLMDFTCSEDAFKAWQRMSEGRPCDYSGMSYEKLSQGTGIQWPCNKDYPNGRERLYDDGHFFTSLDECESFGSHLDTGVPLSMDEYRALNPNGRAILKSANYAPPLEQCNEEYPLNLSTGRSVYHFHTRTKTGRSKALQGAAPIPEIEMCQTDADEHGIADGDQVLIQSRRGSAEMPVRISKIAKGQVFIPFHYGYFDQHDGPSRAANELTTSEWDVVSKQPRFKSGAVKITKKLPIASRDPKEKALVNDQVNGQVNACQSVEIAKPNAHLIGDESPRERSLQYWLAAAHSAIKVFDEVCDLVPDVDSEIRMGIRNLKQMNKAIEEAFRPIVKRYGEHSDYAFPISRFIHDSVKSHTTTGLPYDTLIILHGLHTSISHVEGLFDALVSASQALWDKEFDGSVTFALKELRAQQAWVKWQVSQRSPQILLVPSRQS